MKRHFLVRASGKMDRIWWLKSRSYTEGVTKMVTDPPFPTIGGSDHSSQSSQIPHCPHCGGSDLKQLKTGNDTSVKAVQSALFLAKLSGNKVLC
jgi:hypothetical protein